MKKICGQETRTVDGTRIVLLYRVCNMPRRIIVSPKKRFYIIRRIRFSFESLPSIYPKYFFMSNNIIFVWFFFFFLLRRTMVFRILCSSAAVCTGVFDKKNPLSLCVFGVVIYLFRPLPTECLVFAHKRFCRMLRK